MDVTCEWAGGRCVLRFEATTAGAGKYAKDLAALVRLKERYQQVVWFNLGSRIQRLQDGDRLPVRLGVSLAKRKTTVAPAVAERPRQSERRATMAS